MGGFGYFTKGFGNGLMANRPTPASTLAREKFNFEVEQAKKRAAIDFIKNEQAKTLFDRETTAYKRAENKRKFFKNRAINLMPNLNLGETDLQQGDYQGLVDDFLKKQYGINTSNEAAKFLGFPGDFTTNVKQELINTKYKQKNKKPSENLHGDLKDFWVMKESEEGKGRLPKSSAEFKAWKTSIRPDQYLTESESKLKARKDANVRLAAEAEQDPNAFYEKHNIKMNDDGSIYLDPIDLAPVRLKSFEEVTGKRGTVKAIKELGEQWDDSKELQELLADDEVRAKLSQAERMGLWDKVKGKWSNSIQKWMQNSGISSNSKTATAIARMQRMASEERRLYMGTAVTESELRSSLAWMPNAGDSYETMLNKVNLMAQEGEQMFRRWLDVYSKNADMSPFYKAFGMKRFDKPKQTEKEIVPPQTNIQWGN